MKYLNINKAKKCYSKGENITEFLRNELNENKNTSTIIEMAYDLQASFKTNTNKNLKQLNAYEKGKILESYTKKGDSLLDVGCGEFRMLSPLLNTIPIKFSNVIAFDISWSRLKKGLSFFKKNNKSVNDKIEIFVADIHEIPLQDKCIDIVTSNHSLEPNGASLSNLLSELFRVTKRKLVLFEPSYELNSKEGKERMERLGYIKDIEKEVSKLGGKVSNIIPIKNTLNSLNPTACYVIEPPNSSRKILKEKPVLSVPGTNYQLNKSNSFLESKDTGLLFPILEDIPILRSNLAILATAKFL